MSGQDDFDGIPASPSPASRTVASSLHFARPARGKRSTNDLKKAASRISLRKAASKASMMAQGDDSDYNTSQDEELSRSSSPTPSILSVGNTSQLSLPPVSRDSGLELASEACHKVLEDVQNGSYAVGLLGQKLLAQQDRMRQLMQQLHDASALENGHASTLAEQVQADIIQMKQEQQELMRKLLEVTSIDMAAIGVSATTRAEAEAIIHSYGGGMSSSMSYNSISATPTKPVSDNAREIRRQRNAAAPNLHDDVGFVNDIQQQLINELRRVQTLIAERDKTIAAMAESLEEASRFKIIQEANVKKLESEKDAKDAHLYEAERKEAIVREENDDFTRQLKKNENEIRLLKRQLSEKIDAAESLKLGNEELEARLEGTINNLATMRAKGAADQMTINGLKSQVNDLEVKQRQVVTKIPASASNLSSIMSYDHGSVDSMHGGNDLDNAGGMTARRAGGLNQALPPSESIDESMVNRLRPSDAVKSLELDVAKWKNAALKYRKKWNDERRQTTSTGKAADYDDSTDEDEDVWMEEAAKTGDIRKRSISMKSRIVSSASSRKSAKTMGDAFGIGRHQKTSTPWEEEEQRDNTPDRSFGDDDASSNGGNSTRASLDGYDPHFADPTIRSGAESKAFKRRSTYTQANQLGVKGSPLANQLQLHGDSDEEPIASGRNRVTSLIFEPGALGDELRGLEGGQEDNEDMVKKEEVEKMIEEHEEAMQAALSEMEQEHESAMVEKELAHQTILSHLQEQHQHLSKEVQVAHLASMTEKEESHMALLTRHDAARQEEIQVLHNEHSDTMAQQSHAHTEALTQMQEKHKQHLASRDALHEVERTELIQKHEFKMQDTLSRHSEQHENAMEVARERHMETLSKARETLQAELVNAQMEHKKILGERETLHHTEVQRIQSQHDRALVQLKREQNAHLSDVEATHALFQKQCDEAFAKKDKERIQMLEERDALLLVRENEIVALKGRLSVLENELESLRRKVQADEADIAIQTKALEEAREHLRVEHIQRTVIESKLASLTQEEALSRKQSLDIEDDFQDAVDTSQSEVTVKSLSTSVEGDATIGAGDIIRAETNKTRETSAEVKASTKELEPTRQREAEAQTDELMWTNYQQAQLATIRSGSIMQEENELRPTFAPGGIVVVGEGTPAEESSPRHVRDSISTFGGIRNDTLDRVESPTPSMYTVSAFTRQGVNSSSRRRLSEDSVFSVKADDDNVEPLSSTPDKSKPPIMSVPPPPSMPPPAMIPSKVNRVPAPAFVTTTGLNQNDSMERPLSPEKKTVKLQKGKLRVPPDSTSRPSSRVSGPPPSAYLGRSTVAPRSSLGRLGLEAENIKASTGPRRASDAASIISRSSAYRSGQHPSMRAASAQSFASDVTSDVSRLSGVSSRASDYNEGNHQYQQQRSMMIGPGGQTVTTDPQVLSAITQTMIGDYLFKYTRRILGRSGHSSTRHRRYFWIHPYTRTLYWTLTAPAEAVASEAINKSAFIQDVQVVDDANTSPPGLHDLSIIVITQAREVKFTAPDAEKHKLWVTALRYLVNRETGTPATEKEASEWRQSISRAGGAARQRSKTGGPGYASASLSKRPSLLSPARSFASMARRNPSNDQVDNERTPRARGYSTSQASATQRRDTAAKEYLEQWETLKKYSSKPTSTAVPVMSSNVASGRQSTISSRSDREPMDPRLMTPEQMLEEDMGDKSFDGLENVRTCCDGKHDVSKLDHKSHNHHHYKSRTPRSRASTTSVQSKKSKNKVDSGPLKLTGNAAPQLGSLNLNTMHLPREQITSDPASKVSTSSFNSSGDWFTANEFGGLPARSGRATPSSQTYQSPSASSSPNKMISYSDRLTQIKQNKNQPWLR